jgi:hypothetical protein
MMTDVSCGFYHSFPENAEIVPQKVGQEIPRDCGTYRFITKLTIAIQWTLSLAKLKKNFNIIIPSMPMSYKLALPFQFSD